MFGGYTTTIMDNHLPLIIVIIVLIMLSGFFSATETAYSCVNRIKLKTFIAQGKKNAKAVYNFADEGYNKLVTAILVGNNIVNITASTLATILFTNMLLNNPDLAATLSTIVLTVVVLIFGEITPKYLASIYPEKICFLFYPLMQFFYWILVPVCKIFDFYKLGLTHDASADKNSMKFTTKQFALLLTLFAVGVGGLLTYLNYHYQTKSLSASYSTSERVEKNQLMQEFVVEESDEYDNVETITIVESAFKEFFTGKITYSVAIYEVTTPLDAEQEEACWKYSKSKAKKDENLTFQSYATIVVDKGGDVVSFELN